MDLHSFCFKCAHALLKRTMEGFFSPPLQYPSLLVHLISKLSLVFVIETPRALFSGACQIISTAIPLNGSQPNSFLLSLSALQSSSCLWGLVFSLWFGSSGWLSQQNQLDPPPLPSTHVSVCESMLGSIQEDRWSYEEPDGTQWSKTNYSDKSLTQTLVLSSGAA